MPSGPLDPLVGYDVVSLVGIFTNVRFMEYKFGNVAFDFFTQFEFG
jgi:hypothetical protein